MISKSTQKWRLCHQLETNSNTSQQNCIVREVAVDFGQCSAQMSPSPSPPPPQLPSPRPPSLSRVCVCVCVKTKTSCGNVLEKFSAVKFPVGEINEHRGVLVQILKNVYFSG